MTTTTKQVRPKQLYVGATTCDLHPEWEGLSGDGLALAEACWAAPIGEHLPWLVLADWLDERDDPRGSWVRQFVYWEQKAQAGKFDGQDACEWDDRQKSLAEFTKTESGWRWVGLWGAVAARWCPDGYGVGPQWETWADAWVRPANAWCVLWACGLVAVSQAQAVQSAGSAVEKNASAARRLSYTAVYQSYAVINQADSAWDQACAVRSQEVAALRQAQAVWELLEAAANQSDAVAVPPYSVGDSAATRECQKWLMEFWSVMSAGDIPPA